MSILETKDCVEHFAHTESLEAGEDSVLDIALRPTPRSNDPNDPLVSEPSLLLDPDIDKLQNWPIIFKALTCGTICMFTFIANVNGSNFTVAVVPLSKEFHIHIKEADYLVCFNVLLFGLGNLFWVPLMRVIGKRPVYLSALALLVAANGWSVSAHSYGSLLGSRILSGFAASAADATVPSAIADLVLVESRGRYMMFFHLALSSGLFLGPLINAYLIELHSWRWSCAFIAITAGVIFLCGIFTIRETSYIKQREIHPESNIPKRKRFSEWLSVTKGYNPNGSFFRTVKDIVWMASYPPIIWVGLIIGIYVGW